MPTTCRPAIAPGLLPWSAGPTWASRPCSTPCSANRSPPPLPSPKPPSSTNWPSSLGPNSRAIFVDTPGIHAPHHLLGEWMDAAANAVIADADVCLVLFDMGDPPTENDRQDSGTAGSPSGHRPPTMAAMNKVDLLSEAGSAGTRTSLPGPGPVRRHPVVAVSALHGDAS